MTASKVERARQTWRALDGICRAVTRAVRKGHYGDASMAVRGLGTMVQAGTMRQGDIHTRLLYALEATGEPEWRGRALAEWLVECAMHPGRYIRVPPDKWDPPTIHVEPNTLAEQVREAEVAVMGARLGLYQRAGQVVRLGQVRERTAEGGEREAVRVLEVGEAHLAELMGRAAHWARMDARRKDYVPTRCPVDVARAYLARGGLDWALPELAGVIHAPTLRPDGSLLDLPGYDTATGLFLDLRGETWPEVAENPTREAAAAALAELGELVAEFPFVAPEDRAVALSAMMTAIVRRSLPAAPMHAFTASTPGTGKSYLTDTVAMLATGRPAPGMSWTADEAENGKRLDAALLAGASLIVLDNVTAELSGARLNQILTQPEATARVLGQSRNVAVPCAAFVLANGNNLTIAADMTRRALLCRLDAGVERPELRSFHADPLAQLREDRPRFVAAVLTVLRAYHVAGRPAALRPLGSFEAWSALVRGALLWLGEADPVGTVESVRADDPRRAELAAVLGQWDRVLGDRRVSSREVLEAAAAAPDMREALLAVAGVAGAINTRRLGLWLRANKGKLVGGLKLDTAGTLHGSALWALHGGRTGAAGDNVTVLHGAGGVARGAAELRELAPWPG